MTADMIAVPAGDDGWDSVAILRCGHCVAVGTGWTDDTISRDSHGTVIWGGWPLEFICSVDRMPSPVTDIVRRTP